MKVSINVSKSIFSPRVSLNDIYLVIAYVLRRINRNYNDYDIRERMAELTADEARAEILGDVENAKRNRLAEEFWSSG